MTKETQNPKGGTVMIWLKVTIHFPKCHGGEEADKVFYVGPFHSQKDVGLWKPGFYNALDGLTGRKMLDSDPFGAKLEQVSVPANDSRNVGMKHGRNVVGDIERAVYQPVG